MIYACDVTFEVGDPRGTGTGHVTNAPTVSLGASAGTLTIDGTCTQTEAGTLEVELGGLVTGELAGGLRVLLLEYHAAVGSKLYRVRQVRPSSRATIVLRNQGASELIGAFQNIEPMQAMFAIINFTNLAIFVFAAAIPVVALLVAHHYLAKDSVSDEKH